MSPTDMIFSSFKNIRLANLSKRSFILQWTSYIGGKFPNISLTSVWSKIGPATWSGASIGSLNN